MTFEILMIFVFVAHVFFFYCTHDFWVSHVFISCSCVFLTRAAHDFWVFHVVICCSWVFVFFKENCLLMTFKFVMFWFPAHIFFWQGYSCLLSFSCCQLLLMSFMVLSIKVTHDFWVSHVFVSCSLFWIRLLMRGFFLIVRLLMPFEFLMLSFVAHELFFFMKAAHDFWVSHVFISCSFF